MSQKINNSYLRKGQQHFRVMTKVTARKAGICYSTKKVWLANDCKLMTVVVIANNISWEILEY